jgi:Leucine-rich repeat (LRR) protein
MDFNRISNISSKISQFKYLKELSVNSNKIVEIPNEFKMLRNLSVFNIGNNLLEIIDFELFDFLINLEVLYIYNNSFTGIPYNFYKLSKLKELSLDWFKYCSPPISICIKRPENNSIFELISEHCLKKNNVF